MESKSLKLKYLPLDKKVFVFTCGKMCNRESQSKVEAAKAVRIDRTWSKIDFLKQGSIKKPIKVTSETITIAIVPYPYSVLVIKW